MSAIPVDPLLPPRPAPVVYPDSDGKPMADNTKQLRWIVTLYGNLCALFRDESDVFVAADLLWYPVEGEPNIRAAPDVMAVFGRPKGDRTSYRQWEERDTGPQVAFEILSPSNDVLEMMDKFSFYDEHGVEEYYVYDPECNELRVYTRGMATLRPVWKVRDFVSPRLGIRFDLSGAEMIVRGPDGRPFLTFEELEAARLQAEIRADDAAKRADDAAKRADDAAQQTEQERRQRRRMAELGRKARLGQATAEELRELEQLEADSSS